MASIQSRRTRRGERRYDVRYRDQQGRQRSRSFSARKEADAFKLELERKRKRRTPRTSGRLVDEGELRRWLHSRYEGSSLDGNDGGR
jgi:hypothetical protein